MPYTIQTLPIVYGIWTVKSIKMRHCGRFYDLLRLLSFRQGGSDLMPYYERIGRAGATEAHYCYHDRGRPEPGSRGAEKRNQPRRHRGSNNIRRAAQRLTLDLNENFGPGDWYITLNYRKEERPPDKMNHYQADGPVPAETAGNL